MVDVATDVRRRQGDEEEDGEQGDWWVGEMGGRGGWEEGEKWEEGEDGWKGRDGREERMDGRGEMGGMDGRGEMGGKKEGRMGWNKRML